MIEPNPYPWQYDAWQNWLRYLQQAKVPHAVLLHGHRGCGVHNFALRVGCSLLCDDARGDKPCLTCSGCRLFLSGNHPDCLIVEAEQEQIKVEQIRKAIDFLQLSRHCLHYKIVLFKEADNLNYAAANSLLKTLEEPPEYSVILMTCRQPSALPATIRSRCHRIYLKEPVADAAAWIAEKMSIPITEAQQKLALSNNAPLSLLNGELNNENKSLFYKELSQCLTMEMTIQDFVEHWCDKPLVEIQQWLLEYLQHLIITRAKKISKEQINVKLTESGLADLLYQLYPRQIERCRLAKQSINPRLLLESSLFEWRKAYRND